MMVQTTLNFKKAKEQAIKYLIKYNKGNLESNDIKKVQALENFPTNNDQLHRVTASAKAIIIKAHLKELYPNTVFSIKKPHYGSLHLTYVSGFYPFGLNDIKLIYVNPGNSDSQTDYYDYDLHLLLINALNGDQWFYKNPDELIEQLDQYIYKKKTENNNYYDKQINYLSNLIGVKKN